MGLTLRQVLADINAGLVAIGPWDYIRIPGEVAPEQAEAYRLIVVDARSQSLAGPAGPVGVGEQVLHLSTLGERVLAHGNPGRYRSRTTIAQVNGQYRAEQVRS